MAGGALALVTIRHSQRLHRFVCPGANALVERARKAAEDAPEATRDAFARIELDGIRDEATRGLAVATLVPRGMARIALATGTAFAVLALARYARDGLAAATAGACAAFVGGALSSSVSAAFGRRARNRAQSLRSDWKRALRLAEAELSAESGKKPARPA